MSDAPLVAHSLTEARLYLMVTPCPSCGQGPLRFSQARTIHDAAAGATILADAACGACDAATSMTFHLPRRLEADSDDGVAGINPTDEHSRIIDVAHWLTLFRMGAEEAGRESDKVHARELWIEVGRYLAEALKFFDDPDSDLPSERAFFSDASRLRLRENPEQFSRQRLIGLRAKLPFPAPASSTQQSGKPRSRRPEQ